MTGEQVSGEPLPRVQPGKQARALPGYWLPLLLSGLFLVGTMPLTSYRPWTAGSYSYTYSLLAAYGQGWFWTLGSAAVFLLSAAWYRWRGRHPGTRTPVQGYLVTGLMLTILGSGIPALSDALTGPSSRRFGTWGLWLINQFDVGIVTLLIIATGLWLLARAERSRAAAIIAAVYTVTAILVAAAANTATALAPSWAYPSGGPYLVRPSPRLGSAFVVFSPWPQPAMLLPAAVLLLAGLGTLVAPRLPRKARP